jgi:hypothetical protein
MWFQNSEDVTPKSFPRPDTKACCIDLVAYAHEPKLTTGPILILIDSFLVHYSVLRSSGEQRLSNDCSRDPRSNTRRRLSAVDSLIPWHADGARPGAAYVKTRPALTDRCPR